MDKKTVFPYSWDQNTSICIIFWPKIEKKFWFFLDLEFFSKNLKTFVSNFCGARPHKKLTLMNRNSIYFLGLIPEVLWETEWFEKQLNFTMLSPNSVPEGHCQITSKRIKWIKTRKIRKKLSWKRLIPGKLLPWGHACPLGGRCMCIFNPLGRGRGPARFLVFVTYIYLPLKTTGFSESLQ